MIKEKTIIPVAGGKGGVGKSLFVANLAAALANEGKSTIAVDMDLGSSNLHTYLDIPNIYPGIGDFLKIKKQALDSFLVDTDIESLQFLPGDGKTPFMANIPHAQKLRLIREINKLSADYIILDLGAGTTFNTLDLFGLAKSGIIITTFEYAAIMNVLVFLRNFLLRSMRKIVRQNREAVAYLDEVCKSPITSEPITIDAIVAHIEKIDVSLGEEIRESIKDYRPRFVFNMGDHPDELKAISGLDQTIKERLSLNVDYIGFIFHEEDVRQSVKRKLPLVTNFRDSKATEEISSIAKRVINYWHSPIDNSLDLLSQAAYKRV